MTTTTITFPINVSQNQRYLTTAAGEPFFYHADTAWRIFRLKESDVARYLDDRKAKGFTTLHLQTTNKEVDGDSNHAGERPFAGNDMLAPYEPYWRYLDRILALATERGFFIVMSAAWYGYMGWEWRPHLDPSIAQHYGKWLGTRYKAFNNLAWILGGDNNPDRPLPDHTETVRSLAQALRGAAPHQLLTYHAGPEHTSAHWFQDDAWLDINMAYTYQYAHLQTGAEYQKRIPIRPLILGETGYEGEGNTGFPWSPYLVRRQAYWALLSGACGHAYGSRAIWNFLEDWPQVLQSPGAHQMQHLTALFVDSPWWQLVPDRAHTFVTDGYGIDGTNDLVTSAVAPDGTFALAYAPGPRSLRVALDRMARTPRARWYDPTRGGFAQAEFDSTGRTSTPAQNAGGHGDWVLVLDAR
jgi:hypothetical protein